MILRNPIELALDIRSYESPVVFSQRKRPYPDSFRVVGLPLNSRVSAKIDGLEENNFSPIIFDRIEVDTIERYLDEIGRVAKPRVLAVLIKDVEHEKSVRRLMTATFPWSSAYQTDTVYGRMLMFTGISGPRYSRDDFEVEVHHHA